MVEEDGELDGETGRNQMWLYAYCVLYSGRWLDT